MKFDPTKVKEEQHKRYEEIAKKIFKGEIPYSPAVKSKYSISPNKFNHTIKFS